MIFFSVSDIWSQEGKKRWLVRPPDGIKSKGEADSITERSANTYRHIRPGWAISVWERARAGLISPAVSPLSLPSSPLPEGDRRQWGEKMEKKKRNPFLEIQVLRLQWPPSSFSSYTTLLLYHHHLLLLLIDVLLLPRPFFHRVPKRWIE